MTALNCQPIYETCGHKRDACCARSGVEMRAGRSTSLLWCIPIDAERAQQVKKIFGRRTRRMIEYDYGVAPASSGSRPLGSLGAWLQDFLRDDPSRCAI